MLTSSAPFPFPPLATYSTQPPAPCTYRTEAGIPQFWLLNVRKVSKFYGFKDIEDKNRKKIRCPLNIVEYYLWYEDGALCGGRKKKRNSTVTGCEEEREREANPPPPPLPLAPTFPFSPTLIYACRICLHGLGRRREGGRGGEGRKKKRGLEVYVHGRGREKRKGKSPLFFFPRLLCKL